MVPIDRFRGFAILCEANGKIIEILKDNIGLSLIAHPGQLFPNILDINERMGVLNFFIEVKNKTVAHSLETSFTINSQSVLLSMLGVVIDENLLIVASEDQGDALDYLNELQLINNEQSNTIRYLVKGTSGIIKDKSSNELLNEITILNNELVNLQRELSRKNEELVRLDEMKNRFIGMASHDLRNPLSIISSYATLILNDKADVLPDPQYKYIDYMNQSAKLALAIIDDLLDISRIESGKAALNVEEFDLLPMLSDNIQLNRQIAGKKNIDIVLRHYDKPLLIEADMSKIQQILNNLLNNAIKFSNSGSSIEVDIEAEKSNVLITVKDSGIGVAPEFMDRMFQPFEKASATGTAGEKGTGLGLAIVKKIVESHQGKIWVESKPGEGTIFFVSLPLKSKSRK